MDIEYKSDKIFDPARLADLFLSVGWESGKYPEKLATAMEHSGSVFSAWEGERLVGLVNALDDGVMNAYVHYLLVDPAYQGKGIGRELLWFVTRKYSGFLRVTLVAYDAAVGFYEKCGLVKGEGKTVMSITNRMDA